MATVNRMTKQEAEDFLFMEARLLDNRRLDEWGRLFTPDGVYWWPLDRTSDPEEVGSVLYDDTQQRAYRIHQLTHYSHHAQSPPSRTIHFITNVTVDEGESDSEVTVQSNMLVHEVRPLDQQALQKGLGNNRSVAAHCEHHLRYEGDRWLIKLKKVLLIDRELPLFNMTFIL